jgi:hypothetical protein
VRAENFGHKLERKRDPDSQARVCSMGVCAVVIYKRKQQCVPSQTEQPTQRHRATILQQSVTFHALAHTLIALIPSLVLCCYSLNKSSAAVSRQAQGDCDRPEVDLLRPGLRGGSHRRRPGLSGAQGSRLRGVGLQLVFKTGYRRGLGCNIDRVAP